jgi:hypothetical protein
MARAPISEAIDQPLDARTKASRRFESLVRELGAKFSNGGPKGLADKLRVRSAAAMIVRLEQAQAAAASGEPFEPRELSELSEFTAKAIAAAAPPQGLRLPMFGEEGT